MSKSTIRALPETVSFAQRVFAGQPRHLVKWGADMAVGMSASASCSLTRIADALREPLALGRTIKRLSRNQLDLRLDQAKLEAKLLSEAGALATH